MLKKYYQRDLYKKPITESVLSKKRGSKFLSSKKYLDLPTGLTESFEHSSKLTDTVQLSHTKRGRKEQLETLTKDEEFTSGLVKIVGSHCKTCPELLASVALLNQKFIEDNKNINYFML